MTNTAARFQVVEVKHGYAVKDTRDGSMWSRTYKSVGWAARAAVKLNEATKNLRYS
jgi:hypothetical protein